MNKVDVVITVYNKAETATRAIKSVKTQTLTDFKCIVIDDGSTDNSRQVILDAIKDDARFSYVRIENAGVANARNTAISYGNAPFCTCLDGDDWLQPTFLQVCYDAISNDRTMGIAYTNLLLYHYDGEFTVRKWPETNHELQFEGKNQVPCCNMFRRAVFERLGGYRQRYAPRGAGAEDAEMWLRFFRAGYKAVRVSNEPLFIYSTFTGLTGKSDYKEVDWLAWHNQKPFTTLQKPENGKMHLVHEYDRPEISVIIPVGPGHSHFLVDALDSVEAQTFHNWEVIVVWDGVKDNKYTRLIDNAYPYVRQFATGTGKTKPVGAGFTRNVGASESKGKYLLFLDADDYLQSRFMEITHSAIEHFKASWVYTDIYGQTINSRADYNNHVAKIESEHDQILLHKNDCIEYYWHEQLNDLDMEILWRQGLAPVTCLYNKSDFWEVGGFNEKDNREDWELHLQLASAGKCGLHVPVPLMTYRQNAGFRREYTHFTDDVDTRQELKKADKERLHNKYNLEELKVGCSKCRKRAELNADPSVTASTKLMEYSGPKPTQQGVIYVGKATGRRYPVIKHRQSGKLCIYNVDMRDAKINPIAGLFRPLRAPSVQKTLVSATPKKVEVKEIVGDCVSAKKEDDTNVFLTPLDLPQTDESETLPWYESPESYTIAELKKEIKRLEPDLWQIETMLENELMQPKPRKGVIAHLEGLLK